MFCEIVNKTSQTAFLYRLKQKITAISRSNALTTAFTISKCYRRTTLKTPEKWDSFQLYCVVQTGVCYVSLCECVCVIFQRWLEAIEEHSAFSTHYCSQDPDSEEEEDDVVSVHELSDSIQVRNDIWILIYQWNWILTITSDDKMHMVALPSSSTRIHDCSSCDKIVYEQKKGCVIYKNHL